MLKPKVNLTVWRGPMTKPVRDTHSEPGLRMIRATLITRDEIKCMLCMYETVLTWGPNTILHIRNNRLHCKSIFFQGEFSHAHLYIVSKTVQLWNLSFREAGGTLLYSSFESLTSAKSGNGWEHGTEQICGSCRLGTIRNSVVYV